MAIVDVTALRAGYDSRVVLSLARFTVDAGQHTLVLGPSGCGKSTLLNVLAGLALPMSGEVSIGGQRVDRMTAGERDRFRGRHIGMVMQRLHLISALDVHANLAMAQRLAGEAVDASRIDQVLAQLDMQHKKHAAPRTLSQGEAQRVAIARAVINRPALILADEPTAALDDGNCQAALALLLAQAREHGATLLVATHDQRIRAHFEHVLQLERPAP